MYMAYWNPFGEWERVRRRMMRMFRVGMPIEEEFFKEGFPVDISETDD